MTLSRRIFLAGLAATAAGAARAQHQGHGGMVASLKTRPATLCPKAMRASATLILDRAACPPGRAAGSPARRCRCRAARWPGRPSAAGGCT